MSSNAETNASSSSSVYKKTPVREIAASKEPSLVLLVTATLNPHLGKTDKHCGRVRKATCRHAIQQRCLRARLAGQIDTA